MKIDDVTLTLFAWEDIPSTLYGRHTGRFEGRAELGLLTVRTDEGVEGHAFLGSAYTGATSEAHSLIRFLKPRIMGANPLDREALYARIVVCNRHTSYRAIGAVDVALWDIAGKVAGLPVHRLIGTVRASVPVYASSAVHPRVDSYVSEALRYRDAGWKGYKIHPPTEPDLDIEVCRAVRKAVGDDFRLMLDSTWSYDYPAALRVGRAVEELGYHWYEDPLADDDITNYIKLRAKLDIPILATEYAPGGLQAYAPWILLQATDALRGDVAVKGGITPCLKTAHLAEAFHMSYEVHHGGNSLNNLANLHLICAIPNTEMMEVLLPDEAQRYGLATEIVVGDDGMVRPPEGPGLGADIDFDLIQRKTISVLR